MTRRQDRPRKTDRSSDRTTLSLKALLPGAEFVGCDDIQVTTWQDDADRCEPGDIFVARMSATDDGHEHVSRAVARGAAGIVAERIVSTGGVPLCLVSDSRWAAARLAHAMAGDPARRMRVIAVTGTSGKTTTAWLTAAVLAEDGWHVGVLSDLGCIDADGSEPEAAEYGDPRACAAWLARLADGGCTHAVVEVSSEMLASHALAGVVCETVVITNMASARLDLHGTTRAYHEITARILDTLPPQGCLVTGASDEATRRLIRKATRLRPAVTVLTGGITAGCDVTATPVDRDLHGQTFLMKSADCMVPVAVDAPVLPFVRDCLLAAAVGLRYRVTLEMAARGIEAAGCVPGRVERIDHGQDTPVFIDIPTSGHALTATLASLRRLTRGRLVVLAEEQVAETIGSRGFRARMDRWVDECLLTPAGILEADAEDADIMAYARLDRLLAGLGPHDCLLVLGRPALGQRGPGGPDDGEWSLGTVVAGWLRVAHPPRPLRSDRRAA